MFRSNLVHYIKEKFTSLAQFLRASGFSKGSYYDWTKGRALPEMGKVFEIAKVLDVPVYKLFQERNSGIGKDDLLTAYTANREAYEANARALRTLSEHFGLPDPTVPDSPSDLDPSRSNVFE